METWWHQNEDGTLNFEKVASVIMKHVPKGSDAEFGFDMLRQRIAALEAEKAERERQEPVAWIYRDSINEPWKLGSGTPKSRWEMLVLYAHPLTLREPTEGECREIRRLAKNEECDGSKVCEGRAMFKAVREVMK